MKQTKEIPSWFDLSKYQPSKNFSPGHWYSQLIYRRDIKRYLENVEKPEIGLNPFDEIKKNGLITATWEERYMKAAREHRTKDNELFQREYSRVEKYVVQNLGAISPIPARTILMDYQDHLTPHIKKQLQGDDELIIKAGISLDVVRRHFGMFDGRAMLHVDLNLPDSQLRDEFEIFLTKYRNQLNFQPQKVRRPSEAEIKSLFDYRVLPYIDLHLWELETNQKIHRGTLEAVLCPYGEKTIQAIKRKSLNCLSEKSLEMLRKEGLEKSTGEK